MSSFSIIYENEEEDDFTDDEDCFWDEEDFFVDDEDFAFEEELMLLEEELFFDEEDSVVFFRCLAMMMDCCCRRPSIKMRKSMRKERLSLISAPFFNLYSIK